MLELGTVITVLSTLGVVALIVAVVGVIRLRGKVEDLELARMEIIDVESRLERAIESDITSLGNQVVSVETELNRRIDDEQTMNKASLSRLERNLDKRFDNVWAEVHKLDETLNPNKDLLKD